MRPAAPGRLAYLAAVAMSVIVVHAPAHAQPEIVLQARPQVFAEVEAQGVRLALGGVLRDVHGLALAGFLVEMEVRGEQGHWSTSTVTDEAGRFRWLVRVEEGRWTVAVEAAEHAWLTGASRWEEEVEARREPPTVSMNHAQRWPVEEGALPVFWRVADASGIPRVRVPLRAEASCATETREAWTDAQGVASTSFPLRGLPEERRCVVSWQSGVDDRVRASAGTEVVELVSEVSLAVREEPWPVRAWDFTLSAAQGPLGRERIRVRLFSEENELVETLERWTDTAGVLRIARGDMPNEVFRLEAVWSPDAALTQVETAMEVLVRAPGAWLGAGRWLAWALAMLAFALVLRAHRSASRQAPPTSARPRHLRGQPHAESRPPASSPEGRLVVSEEPGRTLSGLSMVTLEGARCPLETPWLPQHLLAPGVVIQAPGHLPWRLDPGRPAPEQIVLASVRVRVREELRVAFGRATPNLPWGRLTIRQWIAASAVPPHRRAAWLEATAWPDPPEEGSVHEWTEEERALMTLCHRVERILLAEQDGAADYAAFETAVAVCRRRPGGGA